jgi:hypothetical protein
VLTVLEVQLISVTSASAFWDVGADIAYMLYHSAVLLGMSLQSRTSNHCLAPGKSSLPAALLRCCW